MRRDTCDADTLAHAKHASRSTLARPHRRRSQHGGVAEIGIATLEARYRRGMRNLPLVLLLVAFVGCAPLGELRPEPPAATAGEPRRGGANAGSSTPSEDGSVPRAPTSASSEPCMVDPSDGRLKRCHHTTTSGACVHFGQWCNGNDLSSGSGTGSGKSPCLYDPSDGRTKTCHHVTTDGKCAHYGLWCNANELGPEPCMFDDNERRYGTCHHVTTDGKCADYGMACHP